MRFFATDSASQLRYFADADEDHFRWVTDSGYFARTERELIDAARLPVDGRVLEIGCGEGGNLFHLGARRGWTGIDLSQSKLAHARRKLPGLLFSCADAARLPYASSSFDGVLIRDLLHHVPDRNAVLRDAVRVLRPGGVLAAIEPNRTSPFIVAQALLIREERALLGSHSARVRRELESAGLVDVHVRAAQPLPLARLVLHPRLGMSQLGRRAGVARALELADAAFSRFIPSFAWMYIVARALKDRDRVRGFQGVGP